MANPERSEWSRLSELEHPLTMAEGAAAALNMMAESFGATNSGTALAFLAHHLAGHLEELRNKWEKVLTEATGAGNG
ncbi:hypothetical protein [Azospirillum sp. TSO22-1]|uniref:hypothetical protein n=1 Tax=Azospirillum sp. TSO22-1 TaxID=716789 RepID=UPI0011B660DE|nr:hypothetical protein [Azospirillum sp. TSO22-1]